MLDSFKNDLTQLNKKFILISHCIYLLFNTVDFNNKFVDKVSNEEYLYDKKM